MYFNSPTDQMLYTIQMQLNGFMELFVLKERHEMGLVSDEIYKESLMQINQMLSDMFDNARF